MIMAVTGKFQDIISMSPICNIGVDRPQNVWPNVTKVSTEIGFGIVVTISYGDSANVYNNFVNKYHFCCPVFHGTGLIHYNFAYIKELYHLELGKATKIAHKLNDTVRTIERIQML